MFSLFLSLRERGIIMMERKGEVKGERGEGEREMMMMMMIDIY